jgi:ABC-type glycerol-3-phosphate transport system substrate-binding protein
MMRRAGVAAGAALLVITGCSSSHSGANGKSDAAAVTKTWTLFFSSSTPVAQRVALVEDGAAFQPWLASQPASAGWSATVKQVTFPSAGHANVAFALSLGGGKSLPSIAGAAELVGGDWRVSKSTICVVLAAAGEPNSAC